ncbi:DUF1294 domain-containing protein [Chitinibacteraceae bacterium HSL-7]
MVQEGVLRDWNDERGFGFVETRNGERYFLHISVIKRATNARPASGLSVHFEGGIDDSGRKVVRRAAVGTLANKPVSRSKRSGKAGYDLADVVAGAAAVMVVPLSLKLGLPVLYWMLGASALAFLLYWHDKRQAQAGGWRTPEARLHLVALLGGWPGAWSAQRLFRHKSSKSSFRWVFIFTVLCNLAALIAVPYLGLM